MPVVTLKHPFELGGRRYEALTLRRADGGAMRMLDRSGALALMTQMRNELAAATKSLVGQGLDQKEAETRAAAEQPIPQGLFDGMAPILARLADVEEAVIDRLDAEDFIALFERFGEVMPAGPLP